MLEKYVGLIAGLYPPSSATAELPTDLPTWSCSTSSKGQVLSIPMQELIKGWECSSPVAIIRPRMHPACLCSGLPRLCCSRLCCCSHTLPHSSDISETGKLRWCRLHDPIAVVQIFEENYICGRCSIQLLESNLLLVSWSMHCGNYMDLTLGASLCCGTPPN